MNVYRTGRLLFVVLMICVMPLSVIAQEDDTQAMIDVAERYANELWTEWQFDIADEIIADDFEVHFWDEAAMDWETYLETIIEPTSMQQDFSIEYLFMFVDGDYVVAGGSWGGKVSEDIMGDLPVPDNVTLNNGIDIYRIEDGKITDFWPLYNTMSYMQQMGYVEVDGEVMPDEPWDIALGETSSTPEEHKALVEELVQNLNDHDMEAYYGHFSEDAMVHDHDADMNRIEAIEMMVGIQSAWPDHHAEDVMYFAAGDLVAYTYTLFFVNDEIMIGGVNVLRLVDGQVVDEWWLYDQFTLMQLLAPPAED